MYYNLAGPNPKLPNSGIAQKLSSKVPQTSPISEVNFPDRTEGVQRESHSTGIWLDLGMAEFGMALRAPNTWHFSWYSIWNSDMSILSYIWNYTPRKAYLYKTHYNFTFFYISLYLHGYVLNS